MEASEDAGGTEFPSGPFPVDMVQVMVIPRYCPRSNRLDIFYITYPFCPKIIKEPVQVESGIENRSRAISLSVHLVEELI